MADTPLIANVVVLGGNGAMGALFCKQLADHVKQVIAIDLHPTSPQHAHNFHYLRSDVRKLNGESQNALSTADLVIAALPESVMMYTWQDITRHQKPASLLVDTLSVKTPFINAASHSKLPSEIVSINPMFAPSLGFSGQSVVLIDVRHGPIADAFINLLESWGCRLVSLTAEQHDRHTAILQTLTHATILAFGMSLQKLGYDISAVEPFMPPPHRALLSLMARILSADPEVYWDIQSSNPNASEVRNVLAASVKELFQLIENNKKEDFISALSAIEHTLGNEKIEALNQYCAEMFKRKN